jgi:Methyltransferase domain
MGDSHRAEREHLPVVAPPPGDFRGRPGRRHAPAGTHPQAAEDAGSPVDPKIIARRRTLGRRLISQGIPDAAGVKTIIADIMDADLPDGYFDGVFLSNFLEHLPGQNTVATALGKLRAAMEPGGRIAVMGPNFRYCAREYFDCADHTVPLTHVAVTEHLYAAGFDITAVTPRFLPYSFRGLLPPSPLLTRSYLRIPALWRLLGKQFLAIARKPPTSASATRPAAQALSLR